MTGDLFALTYFGLSAASIAAMTIFLVLRQSKPVPVRILLLVTVFLLPFALGWLLWYEPIRRHSGNSDQGSLIWALKKCLDDEKISDPDLAAAWNGADIDSLHTNLWKLLPEPSIPLKVDAKIKTGRWSRSRPTVITAVRCPAPRDGRTMRGHRVFPIGRSVQVGDQLEGQPKPGDAGGSQHEYSRFPEIPFQCVVHRQIPLNRQG